MPPLPVAVANCPRVRKFINLVVRRAWRPQPLSLPVATAHQSNAIWTHSTVSGHHSAAKVP